MAKKIWNHLYITGNPALFKKITTDAENPMARSQALSNAERTEANGWRSWVEHADTGERIFESEAEIAHKKAQPTMPHAQAPA